MKNDGNIVIYEYFYSIIRDPQLIASIPAGVNGSGPYQFCLLNNGDLIEKDASRNIYEFFDKDS